MFDPISLRERIDMISGQFELTKEDSHLDKQEQSKLNQMELAFNITHYQKLIEIKAKHTYSVLNSLLVMSNDIILLCQRQWNYFYTDSHKWMGNCILERFDYVPYMNRNFLALTIIVKSIFRTQQERSYFLSLVQKEDIWDSKNAYRNEVRRIIKEENLKTEDMKELIDKVLKRVRKYCLREPRQVIDESFVIYS